MTDLTQEKIAETILALRDEARFRPTVWGEARPLLTVAAHMLETLAAVPLSVGEPDGMETDAKSRAFWAEHETHQSVFQSKASRDINRLLAREAKAREEEREAIAQWIETRDWWLDKPHRTNCAAAIRARTAPDPQSEIGLRTHLADLSARGLKP